MDVLVSERLTASPYIANVYTHCGVSMVTEFFQQGDLERLVVPEEKWKPKPVTLASENNFTTTDKLRLALEMAEGIAALHGYPDGLMVHNDIQLTQYLRSDQHPQVLKLNDFNRAEVMLWDDEHQKYCRYRNGIGQGDVRRMLVFGRISRQQLLFLLNRCFTHIPCALVTESSSRGVPGQAIE